MFEKIVANRQSPQCLEKGSVTLISEKDNKEDPGQYWPVIFTPASSENTEWILLEDAPKHMEDREVIRNSQYGFTKGKSCQINSVALSEPLIFGEFSRFWMKVLILSGCYPSFRMDLGIQNYVHVTHS